MLFNLSRLSLPSGTTCPFQPQSCPSTAVCPGVSSRPSVDAAIRPTAPARGPDRPSLSNQPVRRSLSLATHSSSFPSSRFLPALSPCHPVLLSPGQKNAAAKNTNHVDCGIGTRLGAQTILRGSVRT